MIWPWTFVDERYILHLGEIEKFPHLDMEKQIHIPSIKPDLDLLINFILVSV